MARWSALTLLVVAACGGQPTVRATLEAPGPPRVLADAVARHARQFDEEAPERPAGSQQELAASAYIVAHLQRAGYVTRLDAVPVRDLVRSTNVVATAPRGDAPSTVVAVAYDTGESGSSNGEPIGVFLEVARALKVAEPEHSVEFVALGAEHAPVRGGHLGSRRLAKLLLEDDVDPAVVMLAEVPGAQRGVVVAGSDAARVRTSASRAGVTLDEGPGHSGDVSSDDVLSAAGFDVTVLDGPPADLASALFVFLHGV